MVKIYKLFSAAAALALAASANAGIYTAYKMDATSATTSNWVQNRGDGFTVTDGVVTYSEGQNNSSSAYNCWGVDCFAACDAKNSGTDNYYVSYNFSVTTGNDVSVNSVDTVTGKVTYKQQGYAIYLSSSQKATTTTDWAQNWWNGQQHWLFSLTEETDNVKNSAPTTTPVFVVNGDTTNLVTLSVATMYSFSAMIDTVARTLKYEIKTTDGTSLVSGIRQIADTVNILPTGIYVGANRYKAAFGCSDLIVGKYVEGDVPNAPSYELAEVFNAYRRYNFKFSEGETLHVKAAEGILADADGNDLTAAVFTYDQIADGTATLYAIASGDITMWTTIGELSSDEVTFTAECGTVKLPTPVAKIVAVSEGYSKTYQITIDNSEVPTQPSITFNYTYGDKSGTDLASGTKLELEGAGVLKIKAVLYGFEDSEEITIVNNQYYTIKYDLDLEHMSVEEANNYGFTSIDDLVYNGSTSGETNWTGRGRMFDYVVSGTDTTKYYMPAAVTELSEAFKIQRCQLPTTTDALDSATAYNTLPYLVLPWSGVTSKVMPLQIKIGIGLCTNDTKENNSTFAIQGLEEGDFAIISKTDNYGSDWGAVYASSLEEAKAAHHGVITDVISENTTFTLYRIQTAITRVLILTQDPDKQADVQADAVENVFAVKAVDNKVYDLAGRVVANPVAGQLYIKNGKLFSVK